jgi:hypothetical protein
MLSMALRAYLFVRRRAEHFLFQGGAPSAKAKISCVMKPLHRKGRLRGGLEKAARQAGDDDISTGVAIPSRQPACTAPDQKPLRWASGDKDDKERSSSLGNGPFETP